MARRLRRRVASGGKRTFRADIASQFDLSIIDMTKMFGSRVERKKILITDYRLLNRI